LKHLSVFKAYTIGLCVHAVCLKVNQHLYTYSYCNGIARQHSSESNGEWSPKNSPLWSHALYGRGLGDPQKRYPGLVWSRKIWLFYLIPCGRTWVPNIGSAGHRLLGLRLTS